MPIRRLLHDDAVPTIFPHNIEKQPQKRKSSIRREQQQAKRQHIEDAFTRNKQVQISEYQYNTKETQTEPQESLLVDSFCQTDPIGSNTAEFGVQCDFMSNFDLPSDNEMPSESEKSDDLDESFVPTEESVDEDESNDESCGGANGRTMSKALKSAFIVYWSSLLILFKTCLHSTCILPAVITDIATKGSQLVVKLRCSGNHVSTWRSQPNVNRYAEGNLVGAAAVLFSANTFQRIANFFDMASIQWICKTTYYKIQKNFLAGVVKRAYDSMTRRNLKEIKKRDSIQLSGDGRCDSPGHNAKYLTYSFMDKVTNKIINFSLTQVTEAGNSNKMEKVGFIKSLDQLKKSGVVPNQITTDRHTQIRKYIREQHSDLDHQFDVWHFVKGLKKRLLEASKKASCRSLQKWLKSITNHLWWACATCGGDEELLREKWISVLFHIQNKHRWTGHKKFTKCEHPKLTKKQQKAKEWLKPNSEAFIALQNIVLDKSILKDLSYLTKFSHTGVLEIFHALYNRWAPKRQHFSYLGMITRSQLAIMDFNAGSNIEQATTKKGDKRGNLSFSKATKNWSYKPIKGQKDRTYLHKMVNETVECAAKNKKLPKPKIPKLPANIASVERPNKLEVMKNQISRFGSKDR